MLGKADLGCVVKSGGALPSPAFPKGNGSLSFLDCLGLREGFWEPGPEEFIRSQVSQEPHLELLELASAGGETGAWAPRSPQEALGGSSLRLHYLPGIGGVQGAGMRQGVGVPGILGSREGIFMC